MKKKLKLFAALLALLLLSSALLTGCAETTSKAERSSAVIPGAAEIDLGALSDASYTIAKAGAYVLSGAYNGQLIVDADDKAKITLYLNGAEITNASGPALYILSADQVTVYSVKDSVNILADGVNYLRDEEGADGAIYAKDDLILSGEGTLTVSGNTAHGIVTKDDLTVSGGTLIVTAVSDGLRGKDSLTVTGGALTVTAGSDGLCATGTDENQGVVSISGGQLTISAQTDGIQAAGSLTISGGEFTIQTGEGSANITLASDAMGGGRGGFGGWDRQTVTASDDAASQKGLKAGTTLTISGGLFTLDTVDDALHAGGDIRISGGEMNISTGDDALHSDTNVFFEGGTLTAAKCYEGLEGMTVTVSGGTIDIVSSDDGINAAGGADSSGYAGFGRGMDMFAATEGCYVTIEGGVITIVSDGDSIDSNGDLTISGGELNLTCNGNGNTAIDVNGTYNHTGGAVTTNDGSENGETFPGGGRNNFGGGKKRW